MGMLFVPITTLALSTLNGREIGEGASFTGMMRQLGGSFGIAVITTFMARKSMIHRNDLVSKLDITDPVLQNKILAFQHSFIAKGMTPDVALKSAYKALDYSVFRQAAVMTYMDVFLFIGLLFLICVPFVLLVRGNRNKKMTMEGLH
jgi:DHA2 family multidrug resistance protein